MERNPKEHMKSMYYNGVAFRKIRPLFFWQNCDKCGNEFRRETMYELQEPSIVGFSWQYYKHGCQRCFPKMEDFKDWCRQEVLLKEEDFNNPQKLLF